MDNVIYRKQVHRSSDNDGWEKEWITLTDEVNRLIVWHEGVVGEDEVMVVIKTFPKYQRTEAIEFAVACAAEAIENRRSKVA